MGNLGTIFRREMAAYFFAPIAYIFIIVFVLINSSLFMTQFFLIGRAEMQSFFVSMPFLLSVFLPAVSMRLWAEEKRGNTLELLLTFPMSSSQLILGKFLASLVFFIFALLATFTIPFMLAMLGVPDLGAIAGGYIGSLLLGAFYLAIGIFISGFVRDQIVAFILSMMACFSIYFVGMNFFAASLDGWVSGLGSYLQQNVGAATHFEAFSKGVIDAADVFYFLLGSFIFLTLNGLWLEGRMRPHAKKLFSFAVIFSFAIFVLGNSVTSGLAMGRFDLTKAKLYTVSDASKQILKDLEAPVTAKLYISTPEKMPAGMKTIEQDLVGKLEEFSVASGGKFQYKVYHLDPNNIRTEFTEKEDDQLSMEERLAIKGVQPFQIQSIDSDEVGVKLIYSSMTLAYKEKPEEVIYQLVPDSLSNLEYTVMSKIFRMTLPGVSKVILVAPFKEKKMDPNFAMLMAQLGQNPKERFRDDAYDLLTAGLEQEGYKVERLGLVEGEEIPSDAKTMIVLEPSKMTERQRYEINRFLVSGGSLFLGMQNYVFDYDPSDGQRLRLVATELEPGLNEMLNQWGVGLLDDVLADEQSEVISIQGAAPSGPFSMAIPVKAPIQIMVSTNAMNPEISITSQLSSLFYLWGSALEMKEDVLSAQNLNADVLFYSSPNSWLVPFSGNEMYLPDFKKDKATAAGPFPLGVYVRGQFQDVFAGKEIPKWPLKENEDETAEETEAESIREALVPAPGKLILVGAFTMFQKQLIPSGGHFNFLVNAIDALTLGEALVKIRSKQPIDRSITRVSASEKIFWRVMVSGLTPAILIVMGFLFWFIRGQAKNAYLKKQDQLANVS